jgi:hypothetical protein
VVAPTTGTTRVIVKESHIHNNDIGVISAANNVNVTAVATVLRRNEISDNVCGVVTSSLGTNASTPVAATDCGAAGVGSGINDTTVTTTAHNGINQNGTGVFGRGSLSVTEIAHNHITGNSGPGLRRLDSATIRTTSPATNVLSDNGAGDAPNATTTLTKRVAKRARSRWSKDMR